MMTRLWRLLVPLLLLAALVPPASATTTRVRSLGGSGDDFEDDSNVQRWPGSLIDYPNLAALEFGTWNLDAGNRATNRGGSLHARLDEAGRWGSFGLFFADRLPEPEPGGYVSAIYAREFGPLVAALSFRGTTYGTAVNELGPADFVGETTYLHSWGGGIRFDLGDRVYLDAAGEYIRSEVEFDDLATGRSEREFSDKSHALRLRAFVRVNDRVVLVPRVDYAHDLRPVIGIPLNDIADLSAWRLRAGLAANVLLNPDNFLVVSGEYFDNQRDWQARYSDYASPDSGWRDAWHLAVRFGVESRLLPWLSVRAGAAYRRQTDEWYLRELLPGNEIDFAYRWDVMVDVPVSIGVGAHLGDFDCDLDLSDGAPLGDSYLPAGVADLERAARTSITLRYSY